MPPLDRTPIRLVRAIQQRLRRLSIVRTEYLLAPAKLDSNLPQGEWSREHLETLPDVLANLCAAHRARRRDKATVEILLVFLLAILIRAKYYHNILTIRLFPVALFGYHYADHRSYFFSLHFSNP